MVDQNYENYLAIVNEHILDFLPEIDNKSITLYDSMKYSLMAGGKRLRPVLLLGACEMCGGDVNAAIPYACAIEYVHTYSLIHDDLPCMDDDDLRRGIATNHKVYGEDIATLAGDGLLNSAFEAMYRDMFLYFDDPDALKARVRAAYEIAKGAGCTGMIAGQVADVESEGKACSPEMLDYIHLNKTAALITAAVRAGAMLGNADKKMLDDLTDYAEAIGLAFQIQDDMLDVTGTVEELGKNVGMDKELSKTTYPAVHGMDASKARADELHELALDSIADYYDNAEFFINIVEALRNRRK
jgi:geranylgeranyl diphosphate synthase type II